MAIDEAQLQGQDAAQQVIVGLGRGHRRGHGEPRREPRPYMPARRASVMHDTVGSKGPSPENCLDLHTSLLVRGIWWVPLPARKRSSPRSVLGSFFIVILSFQPRLRGLPRSGLSPAVDGGGSSER